MVQRIIISILGRSLVLLLGAIILFISQQAEGATTNFFYSQSYSPYEMRITSFSESGSLGSGTTIYTSATGSPKAVAVDNLHGHIYFSDPMEGKIFRTNIDGSSVTEYLTGVYAEGIAVDPFRNYLYYTQSHTKDLIEHYNVVRVTLADGLGSTNIYTTATGTPEAVAVDHETGDVYFSDPHKGVEKIFRVTCGDSNPVEFLHGVHAYGLAISNGCIYYSEACEPNFKIYRATLSSPTSKSEIYNTSTGTPRAIMVDSINGKIYFSDIHSTIATIYQANLDGTNLTPILSGVNAGGIDIYRNTVPIIHSNSGLSINEDSLGTIITNLMLQATDFEQDTPNIIFTVGTAPAKGELKKGTDQLITGSTFTQEDIDNELIKYLPTKDTNGLDSFTFTVSDSIGETSESNTFNIEITSINDAPSFTGGGNQAVSVDAGNQSVPGWATNISAGSIDEAGQTVIFNVYNDNPTLFSVQPSVEVNGALSYTPAAGATGIAKLTVTLQDSGGTEGGGIDTSLPYNFVIQVCVANGSGTMNVSPSDVIAGQQGITLTFAYTAGVGGMSDGQISLEVPKGWDQPSTNQLNRGYTTANLGSVSVSEQMITVSGITLAEGGTLILTYGDKSGGAPGVAAPITSGTTTWAARAMSSSSGSLVSLSTLPSIIVAAGATDSNKSSVQVDTTTLPADGTSVANITVTLKDIVGNPLGGQTVALDQGSCSSVITPETIITDSDGKAIFTVQSTRAETVTYSALDIGNTVALAQTVQVVFQPGVKMEPTSGTIDEGASIQYTLSLISQPTADVSVNLTPNDSLSVDKATLSFSPTNYSIPQTVTIHSPENNVVDGIRTGIVTHAMSSSDSQYNGLSVPAVTLNIRDNDIPGISLVQSGGSTDVIEGVNDDTYTIVLNTLPADTVTLSVYGGSLLEVSPETLIFDTVNWNMPQTVTVRAVNDDITLGHRTENISHCVVSNDTDYNGMTIPDLTVSINDDDSPGISIIQSGGSTQVREGGEADRYEVVLNTKPSDSVTLSVYGDSQVNTFPETLVFLPSEWDFSQTVTITALDDSILEGEHTASVTHSVYSADSDYNNIFVPTITVNITDNDTPLLIVTNILPTGSTGTPYSATLDATGGNVPFTWRITGLPNGLSATSNGTISGTPNVAGVFLIDAIVSDDTGQSINKQINIRILGSNDGNGHDHNGRSAGSSDNGATKQIDAPNGGTVNYRNVLVEIPAGVLSENSTLNITQLTSNQADNLVSVGMRLRLGSEIYEIITSGSNNFGDRTITISIKFDSTRVDEGHQPVIYYYNESTGEWLEVPTEIRQEDGKWYAVTHVNHLTKFAVFAKEIKKKVIILTLGKQTATVGGIPCVLDALPYVDLQSSRTMVPVRFISEAIGAEVKWDAETHQIIIKGEKEISLTIGSKNMLVDGKSMVMDCAPVVLSPGRTFIPLRFVCEDLSATVDYDGNSGQITIIKNL